MLKLMEKISERFLLISLLCYLASFFLWDFMPENVVDKIYAITMFNLFMVLGVVIMLLSKTGLSHFVGTGMFCVFSWILYIEIAGNPYDWTKWNIGTFFVDAVSSIFISMKLKELKNRYNG